MVNITRKFSPEKITFREIKGGFLGMRFRENISSEYYRETSKADIFRASAKGTKEGNTTGKINF